MLYFTELPVTVAAVSVFYTPDDGRVTPETWREIVQGTVSRPNAEWKLVFSFSFRPLYFRRKMKNLICLSSRVRSLR